MSPKQIVLALLTAAIALVLGIILFSSWNQPQIQSQLELYQTNLTLRASQWQPQDPQLQELRDAALGEDVFSNAATQYREARERAEREVERARRPLTDPQSLAEPQLRAQQQQARSTIAELTKLEHRLALRSGLLQAKLDKEEEALDTWRSLEAEEVAPQLRNTAQILARLWQTPPQSQPGDELQLQADLEGWFRDYALERFYSLRGETQALARVRAIASERARRTVLLLALTNGFSLIAFLLGVGLLLFLGWQRLRKGKDSAWAATGSATWSVPWNWEAMVLGVAGGFFVVFFIGQIVASAVVVPLVLEAAGTSVAALGIRGQAGSILASYLLSAAASLGVLYAIVRPFRPLPEGWFRFRFDRSGFLWGLGGYFIAVPLVVAVSLLNESIWQGRGGSNPILPIALEGRDAIAIGIFFTTASIVAPIFEEITFRAFLLPSLTRYIPAWGAIVASSFIFAAAHLSLSEVLPLLTLGIVLGAVYARSQNLLAPILLHCLWNSATLASLFVLGSGMD